MINIDISRTMKIYIIGTSCSGKTTLARNIAEKLNITHIELDQLWWLPNWQEREREEFREIVEAKLTSEENWVIDGNYRRIRDMIIPRVDHIIWLNLPFYLVFSRSITRTIKRIITRESICNGNHENLSALLSADGMPAWVIRTYKIRKQYGESLKAFDERMIELKSQKQINVWLKDIS